MRILGLDLSLRSTGYVLLDEDHVAWFGTVGSDTLREVERLAMFDVWIRKAIEEHKLGMAYAAIEGYSYGSPLRATALGELGGVIKLALFDHGIDTRVVAPGTWKKVLCGNGSLDKNNAAIELYKRHGVEFHSQDVLDAWAVAMCLRRQLLGLDKPEPKVRKRKPAGDLLEAMS
jgi:Holliday junction resolvasome RuvABC endonuclease subunit